MLKTLEPIIQGFNQKWALGVEEDQSVWLKGVSYIDLTGLDWALSFDLA
jgi:hypothetical protein